jgi:hypothetical protein
MSIDHAQQLAASNVSQQSVLPNSVLSNLDESNKNGIYLQTYHGSTGPKQYLKYLGDTTSVDGKLFKSFMPIPGFIQLHFEPNNISFDLVKTELNEEQAKKEANKFGGGGKNTKKNRKGKKGKKGSKGRKYKSRKYRK